MPIDPRQFALTLEGREAERFADLERALRRTQRRSYNRIVVRAQVTGGPQLVATNTPTQIVFDTEEHDTADSWSPFAPTVLVAPLSGVYLVTGYVSDTHAAEDRTLSLTTTGIGHAVNRYPQIASGTHEVSTQGLLLLEAGDTAGLLWTHTVSIPISTVLSRIAWDRLGAP